MISRPVFAALALLALSAPVIAGCAADNSRYPSLARRDAERMVGSADPAAPDRRPALVVPAPPPAGLVQQLAALSEAARQANAKFQDRRPRADRAVSGTAAVASDRWADAQVALAELESARSDTMIPLADLDALLARGAVTAAETGDGSALDPIVATRAEVAGLVEQQDAILARLRGRMN